MLIDRLTGKRATVVYNVDRVSADQIAFNQGSRVENAEGEVISISSPAGGVFDSSSPPGGWVRRNLSLGMRWQLDYVPTAGDKSRYELLATVTGESKMRVDGVDLPVMQISYRGWRYAAYGAGMPLVPAATPISATAWYSADLRRVIKFEAKFAVPPFSSTDEVLELARVLH